MVIYLHGTRFIHGANKAHQDYHGVSVTSSVALNLTLAESIK